MNIKIIGSGSSGNSYRIDDGQTALLIECGLPVRKIKECCNYNLSAIAGCIVSHEHKDHSLACNDLMKSGINVWMTSGTAKASKAETYGLKLWNRDGVDTIGNPFYHAEQIGTFSVKPYMAHHDAAEPVFYSLESDVTGEKLLFVTDSYYIDYRFGGLTHIMVEANFSESSLADTDNDPRRRRLRRSHMSLENCIKLLRSNDLSRCKGIWLIHLSSSNGDAEGFKRAVQEATGCPTYIA